MLPFKLAPAFQDYLWGGDKLKSMFHKQTDMPVVAESWELSAHPDGDCTIATGALSGTKFSAFVQQHPQLLGSKHAGADRFPVMIKYIDAKQSLSIQVHPDDAYAQRVEHEPGKTEMWYILDAEPDAFLYFGFTHQVTASEMKQRTLDNTLTDVLRKLYVRPGDVVYIPSGTVHAIGAGILLAEVQQNSNSTYRVYDFGRKGADGKQRELHVDKALEVTVRKPASLQVPGSTEMVRTPGYSSRTLVQCDYFAARLVELNGAYEQELDGSSFVSLLCLEGEARLGELEMQKGDSVFVPSDTPNIELEGKATLLITTA